MSIDKPRKKKLRMEAERKSIAPKTMLANALAIASAELLRLQQLSALEALSPQNIKKYAILISSLVKLSEENRLVKAQSQLKGLTEAERLAKVVEAVEVLAAENEKEEQDDEKD